MWPLALTQGAMILSPDIRAWLSLSRLRGLPAKCPVGTEDARETVISEGEMQGEPHFSLGSGPGLPSQLEVTGLCSAHLELTHGPEWECGRSVAGLHRGQPHPSPCSSWMWPQRKQQRQKSLSSRLPFPYPLPGGGLTREPGALLKLSPENIVLPGRGKKTKDLELKI